MTSTWTRSRRAEALKGASELIDELKTRSDEYPTRTSGPNDGPSVFLDVSLPSAEQDGTTEFDVLQQMDHLRIESEEKDHTIALLKTACENAQEELASLRPFRSRFQAADDDRAALQQQLEVMKAVLQNRDKEAQNLQEQKDTIEMEACEAREQAQLLRKTVETLNKKLDQEEIAHPADGETHSNASSDSGVFLDHEDRYALEAALAEREERCQMLAIELADFEQLRRDPTTAYAAFHAKNEEIEALSMHVRELQASMEQQIAGACAEERRRINRLNEQRRRTEEREHHAVVVELEQLRQRVAAAQEILESKDAQIRLLEANQKSQAEPEPKAREEEAELARVHVSLAAMEQRATCAEKEVLALQTRISVAEAEAAQTESYAATLKEKLQEAEGLWERVKGWKEDIAQKDDSILRRAEEAEAEVQRLRDKSMGLEMELQRLRDRCAGLEAAATSEGQARARLCILNDLLAAREETITQLRQELAEARSTAGSATTSEFGGVSQSPRGASAVTELLNSLGEECAVSNETTSPRALKTDLLLGKLVREASLYRRQQREESLGSSTREDPGEDREQRSPASNEKTSPPRTTHIPTPPTTLADKVADRVPVESHVPRSPSFPKRRSLGGNIRIREQAEDGEDVHKNSSSTTGATSPPDLGEKARARMAGRPIERRTLPQGSHKSSTELLVSGGTRCVSTKKIWER